MSEARIALIGAGAWGQNYIRVLQKMNVLAAICEIDLALTCGTHMPHGVIRTQNTQEIMDNETITGVVIATPSPTHADLASLALSHGKDVLVEKPCALSLEDTASLVSLADSSGQVLMVGHLMLYHAGFLDMCYKILSGDIGTITRVVAQRLSNGKVRETENVLWSFGPHDLSMVYHLLPWRNLQNVSAHGRKYNNQIDIVAAEMQLFAPCTLLWSWLHDRPVRGFSVYGSEGFCHFDGTTGIVYGLPGLERETHQNVPEPLLVQCEHFLECILSRREPRTGLTHIVRVTRILDLLQRSIDCGKRVEIPYLSQEVEAPWRYRTSTTSGTKNLMPTVVETEENNNTMNQPTQPSMCSHMNKIGEPWYSHGTVIVDDGCDIGSGTRIWHFSHVSTGAKIGSHCTLGQNVYVAPGVTIGNYVKIQNNVSVYEGVTIEKDAFIGPSVVFTNVKRPRSLVPVEKYEPTLVKRGASIGANATILCGVTIGEYAMVGAGVVVTRDIVAHGLALGEGRIASYVCECGGPLRDVTRMDSRPLQCGICGVEYEIIPDSGSEVAWYEIRKVTGDMEIA